MSEKLYRVKRSSLHLIYFAFCFFLISICLTFFFGVKHYIQIGICKHSLFLTLASLCLIGGTYVLFLNYKKSIRNQYQFQGKCLKVFMNKVTLSVYSNDVAEVQYGLNVCRIILKNRQVLYLNDEQEDLSGFKLRMQKFFPR